MKSLCIAILGLLILPNAWAQCNKMDASGNWMNTDYCYEPVELARLSPAMMGSVPVAAGCATTDTSLAHDYILEGFETATTGFNDGNSLNVTENPNSDNIDGYYDTSALTTGKGTGQCNRGLQVVAPVGGPDTYVSWDYGSAIDVDTIQLTIRFYFYINTAPDASELVAIFSLAAAGPLTGVSAGVDVFNNAGSILMRAGGTDTSNWITVSTGQWYVVTITLDTARAAGGSSINVAGSTQTFQRTTWDPRYFHLGAFDLGGTDSGTFTFDLLAVD
jgi:hypothetical protein